ncbi:hypothetical protein HDU83_003731 [Entophlyctis luteolus]|nr:hypothetical protein HDU83_003731 [Entophlyctis luteolus]
MNYLLFFREHNRRAGELALLFPEWNDELLFQRARRWVIAIVQKITVYNYIPIVTGTLLPDYAGYNPDVNPQIDLFFANVAFRYGHSAINELFATAARLVSIHLEAKLNHKKKKAFYANLVKEVLKYGMESILRGFAFQRDQVIDTHFVSEVRNYLPLNPGHYFDLAAIGIQRGRDLCIPDYATVRRFLNMTEALLWSDITSDMDVQRILSELYDDINDVDSYAGSFEKHFSVFAEDKVDANSLVGPMQRWSIREQFQRLRDGDRFWYENPGILSEFEMDALANMTLGELVMRNTNISWYPADPFVAVDASTKFVQKESPQPATSVVNQVNALGMLSLMWTIRLAEGAIDFRFESNSTGWFGFGFGKNMIDADILFVNDDGTGMYTVQDSWSTSTQPIVSDVAQGGVNNVLNGMDITASQSFSKRVVTFSRLLNTGDPFDTVIVNGYSAYILGLVAGYYGVVDITTGTAYNAYLPYAYIVSVLITPIVAVIYGQLILLKKKRDNQKISMADMLSLPLFTWDDINQRVASGSKWLVIESIIYDTENYLKSHPGGQAAILRMIGLDASGFE